MVTETHLFCPEGWEERGKPHAWNCRFTFADYAATRAFLDHLADLSEEYGYYPNLNFARDYVVITIQFEGNDVDAKLARYAHAAQAAYVAAG